MSVETSVHKDSEVKSTKKGTNNEQNKPKDKKVQSAEKIKPGKKTLKKQATKLILDTPYTIKPFLLDSETEKQLLSKFYKLLEEYPELKFGLSKPNDLSKSVPSTSNEKKPKITPRASAKGKLYRSELVFGTNAVIRAVEKKTLVAVIVSYPAQLPMLIEHIVPLCATQNCPCICVRKFSENVASRFGMSSLLALGFKEVTLKITSIFHTLVGEICNNAPNPHEVHRNLFSNNANVTSQKPKEKQQAKITPAPQEEGLTFSQLYIRKSEPNNQVKEENFLSFSSTNIAEMEDSYFPERFSSHSESIPIQVVEKSTCYSAKPVLKNLSTNNSQNPLLIHAKVDCVGCQGETRKRKRQDKT